MIKIMITRSVQIWSDPVLNIWLNLNLCTWIKLVCLRKSVFFEGKNSFPLNVGFIQKQPIWKVYLLQWLNHFWIKFQNKVFAQTWGYQTFWENIFHNWNFPGLKRNSEADLKFKASLFLGSKLLVHFSFNHYPYCSFASTEENRSYSILFFLYKVCLLYNKP